MPRKTKTAGRPINSPTATAAGLAAIEAAADRMADSLARWLAPRILAGLGFIRDAFAAWARELASELEHNSRPAGNPKTGRRRRPVIVTATVVRPAPAARALPTRPRVPRLTAPACSRN